MRTALLSSYRPSPELASFARQLVEKDWKVLTDPVTSSFLTKAGVKNAIFEVPTIGGTQVILTSALQVGLIMDTTPANRSAFGEHVIDLLVVECQPLQEVLGRENFADQTPVLNETFRSWAVMAAIVGFRPVVTDLKDLPRVLEWIENDQLHGGNLHWLWAKATTMLSIRMTALAKFISYGTSPGGMLIGVGLPEPDSPEWEEARLRTVTS